MANDTKITNGESDASNESDKLIESVELETPAIDPSDLLVTPEIARTPTPSITQTDSEKQREDETEYERIQRLKLNTDDVPHSGVINDDIAKILNEVKLPERRDFKAQADIRTPAPSTPAPAPTQQPATEEKPKERDIVTSLHTLKDDLQDVVRTRKISVVRAAALEQDKKRADPIRPVQTPAALEQSRKSRISFFFAFLLVIIGATALGGVAYVTQSKSTPLATQYPSIIFAEQTVTLPIESTTPVSLKTTLAQARNNTTAPLGSITHIIPTISTTSESGVVSVAPATLNQFLAALGVHAPDQLLRGLGTTFFFGIHSVDINSPVFIIPVTSYDLAFTGMLAWEPTMNQDLAPAFDAVPALMTGPDGLPIRRTFTDAFMLNCDIRELKNDAGAITLYYSFPTTNILVISESSHSFTEILSRLQAQRQL